MSIGQKLEQVADAVYTKGGLDASPQETVSGEIVAITDISPIEHNVAVKAASKNLLPYPYQSVTKTTSGITYTDNGDGSVTVEGTSTAYPMFYFTQEYPFEVGETYTFGEEVVGVDMYIRFTNENGETKYATKTITWKEGYKLQAIYLQVNPNNTVSGTTHPYMVKGNSYDGVYTPYVPDVSVATVKTCGKNLFNNDTSLLKVVKYIPSNGGEERLRVGYEFNFPAGIYKATLKQLTNTTTDYVYGAVVTEDNIIINTCHLLLGANNATPLTITIPQNAKLIIYNGSESLDTRIAKALFERQQIQLEVGTAATPYEPYIQPTSYPIAADGTVEGVTSIYPNMTIATDTDGVIIEANCYQDGKKVKENLIDMILSLGGVINE